MEIKFADSFYESVKKLNRRQTWWYKTYEFFTYRLPEFIKNVYKFRKELYNHRWWDYSFTLQMLKRSLEIQVKGMEEKGYEVKETLDKKLIKMKRTIEILENRIESKYIDMAEEELGRISDWNFSEENYTDEQRAHDKKVFQLAQKLENSEWKELWRIIEGQNYKSYNKEKHGEFNDWYDGSGILGWWD